MGMWQTYSTHTLQNQKTQMVHRKLNILNIKMTNFHLMYGVMPPSNGHKVTHIKPSMGPSTGVDLKIFELEYMTSNTQ